MEQIREKDGFGFEKPLGAQFEIDEGPTTIPLFELLFYAIRVCAQFPITFPFAQSCRVCLVQDAGTTQRWIFSSDPNRPKETTMKEERGRKGRGSRAKIDQSSASRSSAYSRR